MQWAQCTANDTALHRFGHTCSVVDATGTWGTELIVVFGGVAVSEQAASSGSTEQHAARADVQVLTADGADAWFQPQIHGPATPAARAFHAAAVVNQHVYVFGGHVVLEEDARRKRTFFNDLWRLDTESWQWQQMSSSGGMPGPTRRDMTTLTALGTDALLVFGGRSESGRTLADMWLFDIARQQWHLLKAGGAQPVARKMHAAVYVNGRVLMCGGERDAGVLDDFWSLKLPLGPLASWLPQQLQHQQQQAQQAHPGPLLAHGAGAGDDMCRWTQIRVRPAPPPRFGHSLVVVGGAGRLLLMFGGCLDTAGFLALTHAYVQCAELWVLDLASFSWVRESPQGAGAEGGTPTERMCHSMVALSDNRLLLLGGRRKEGVCRDVWWLHVSPPPPVSGQPAAPPPQPPRPSTQPASDVLAPAEAVATASGLDVLLAAAPAAGPLPPPPPPSAPPGPTLPTPALLKSFFAPASAASQSVASLAASSTGSMTPVASQGALQAPSYSPAAAPSSGLASGSNTPRQSASGLAPSSGALAGSGGLGLMVPASTTPPDLSVQRNTSRGKLADLKTSVAAGATSVAASATAAVSKLLGGRLLGGRSTPGSDAAGPAAEVPPAQAAAQPEPAAPQPPAGVAAGPQASLLAPGTAGADSVAEEMCALRVQFLHLPPVPQAVGISRAGSFSAGAAGQASSAATPLPAPASFDVTAARAVLQELQQLGQQQHAGSGQGSPLPPHTAVARARSHLCGMEAHEVTLQELDLMARDYGMLAHSHSLSLGPDVQAGSSRDGVKQLLASLPSLSLMHVVPDVHALRLDDVPLLLSEYRQLCSTLLPGASAA